MPKENSHPLMKSVAGKLKVAGLGGEDGHGKATNAMLHTIASTVRNHMMQSASGKGPAEIGRDRTQKPLTKADKERDDMRSVAGKAHGAIRGIKAHIGDTHDVMSSELIRSTVANHAGRDGNDYW